MYGPRGEGGAAMACMRAMTSSPRPEVIGDAGGHGWGDFQRLVDTDEVVVDEVDCQGIDVVFDTFAEGIREA